MVTSFIITVFLEKTCVFSCVWGYVVCLSILMYKRDFLLVLWLPYSGKWPKGIPTYQSYRVRNLVWSRRGVEEDGDRTQRPCVPVLYLRREGYVRVCRGVELESGYGEDKKTLLHRRVLDRLSSRVQFKSVSEFGCISSCNFSLLYYKPAYYKRQVLVVTEESHRKRLER